MVYERIDELIFQIKRQAMADALDTKHSPTEPLAMPTSLLARADLILEWYLRDLPKQDDA